jgi:hypothetical protein
MTENTQVKMPTVDCLELVIPFLIFDSEDDFYFLQILQRKKENENLGSNSRAVKNYYIKSVDRLRLGEVGELYPQKPIRITNVQ